MKHAILMLRSECFRFLIAACDLQLEWIFFQMPSWAGYTLMAWQWLQLFDTDLNNWFSTLFLESEGDQVLATSGEQCRGQSAPTTKGERHAAIKMAASALVAARDCDRYLLHYATHFGNVEMCNAVFVHPYFKSFPCDWSHSRSSI